MLRWLPAPLKGSLALLLVAINTIVMCTPLFALSLTKLLIPLQVWQHVCSRMLIVIAESWIGVNNTIQRITQRTRWHVQGLEGLKYEGWYFVSSNHQSWTDIMVLQRVFNRRIPFLKFFLKKELIWVPVMGLAWWALDFPFMRRFSKEFLAKHPEMKGKDLETTRKACEKFRKIPVSVMNFMEGTRLTVAKHAAQKSPFRNLLKPKAGGASFVLSSMGSQIRSMVDVTVYYPQQANSFWDFLCGRVQDVVVRIQEREIPAEMSTGDYENDPVFREKFQQWVNEMWLEKDALLDSLKVQYGSQPV